MKCGEARDRWDHRGWLRCGGPMKCGEARDRWDHGRWPRCGRRPRRAGWPRLGDFGVEVDRGGGELRVVETGVRAVALEQLVVVALLDDAAVLHHEDHVGTTDR